MGTFTFECSIDGQHYSLGLLAIVRYQRDLHTLHMLKRLGASVTRRGKALSDDEIDLLSIEEALEVSAATRSAHSPDEIRALFKEQLAASDRRWKQINAASDGMELQTCIANVTIMGISFEEFSKNMATQAPFLSGYPYLHPDHYFIAKTGDKLNGLEIFGMYGGPSEMSLTPVENLVVPIERDASYPFTFGAEASLADGTNSHAPASMQFKPIDGGLQAKLGCCFPAKAPKEMVEGHKLHLALEFWGFAKAIAAVQ